MRKERKFWARVFHRFSYNELESHVRHGKFRREIENIIVAKKSEGLLESCSWLSSVLWCFSFFLPVVKNNGEEKFIGLSPPAEGFKWGCLFQSREEVLEAGLLEDWGGHGWGLSVVSFSSVLTVSGLSVWKSVLAIIFLYQPPSSHWKQQLLSFFLSVCHCSGDKHAHNLMTCSFFFVVIFQQPSTEWCFLHVRYFWDKLDT